MSATSAPPRPNAVVLHGTDWQTYTRLLKVFAERPGMRLTYDRGSLEILSPLFEHDNGAEFLGRLVVTATEELGLEIVAGGSVTLRRRRRQRGLEPDRCCWIASEPQIRGKSRLDLRVDPPPDLAIEVDTTHSSLDRMKIYAALGVPEVWRLDGGVLTFHLLGARRRYSDSPVTLAFPQITPADLTRFLNQRSTLGENATVQQFRLWLRSRRPGGSAAPTP
jgi:Uma2 family endonuclease